MIIGFRIIGMSGRGRQQVIIGFRIIGMSEWVWQGRQGGRGRTGEIILVGDPTTLSTIERSSEVSFAERLSFSQRVTVILYSVISDIGPSEKGTTSLQRTLFWTPFP